jgi:dTDP-4-amino-4,6-dideoxygalactose transaminase
VTIPSTGARIDYSGSGAAYQRHREQILAAIDEALSSGEPLGGPPVAELERHCASRLGRTHAAAVASGTDAVTIGMRACGIGPGQEVITSAFSFIASASAIARTGAMPVYVDITPSGGYLMDIDALENALTGATTAILAVHLFGKCLPARPLREFAERNGLLLIEDAAQAFGAARDGQAAGTYGHLAAFSFDPAKVLGGITTGGLITTSDPNLHHAVLMLRSHGRDPATGVFARLGDNSRMSSINAAYLLHGLTLYAERAAARAHIADRYHDGLTGINGLTLPAAATHGEIDNHHKFVIATPRRDELRRHLSDRGVPTKVHYATALPDHPALARKGRISGDARNARTAARQVLSLPIHPQLSEDDVTRVVTTIRDFPW